MEPVHILELSSSFGATISWLVTVVLQKIQITAPHPHSLPFRSACTYINTSAPSLISRDRKFPVSIHCISSFSRAFNDRPEQNRTHQGRRHRTQGDMASRLGSSQLEVDGPANGTTYQVRVWEWKGTWTPEEDKLSIYRGTIFSTSTTTRIFIFF